MCGAYVKLVSGDYANPYEVTLPHNWSLCYDGVWYCVCGAMKPGATHIHAYMPSGVCSDCCYDLFVETASLPILTLPKNLKTIKENAFTVSAVASVIVPDGCEAIGDYAFANCLSLRIIRMPNSVTKISQLAFAGCVDVVTIAPTGSAAIEYAKGNGMQYVAQ